MINKINKQELETYINEGKKISEIAEIYQCAYCTVQRRLKKLDIKVLIGMRKGSYKHSEKIKKSLSISRVGKNNPAWKGDNIGYTSVHGWVRKYKPCDNVCEHCGSSKKKLDLASKRKVYTKNFSEWLWLCRSCHWKFDGKVPPNATGRKHSGETIKKMIHSSRIRWYRYHSDLPNINNLHKTQ